MRGITSITVAHAAETVRRQGGAAAVLPIATAARRARAVAGPAAPTHALELERQLQATRGAAFRTLQEVGSEIETVRQFRADIVQPAEADLELSQRTGDFLRNRRLQLRLQPRALRLYLFADHIFQHAIQVRRELHIVILDGAGDLRLQCEAFDIGERLGDRISHHTGSCLHSAADLHRLESRSQIRV